MNLRLSAANANDAEDTEDDISNASARSPLLLEWLTKLTHPNFSFDRFAEPELTPYENAPQIDRKLRTDDWNMVTHLCGYNAHDFLEANASLPLNAAEISYFRRNHRGTDSHVSKDFLTAQTDLPSPLAELYGLYRHRARLDAEAALWLAQSTSSLRVASVMADLLSIGAFANGLEYVSYLGVTYSVPCAFDTSIEIDFANREAMRRLVLPSDHPSHFLKLTPDDLGLLAASIAEKNALSPTDFLDKANLLSESRQDVTRLPKKLHFSTVLEERDLPLQTPWVDRLIKAYVRLFPEWVMGAPTATAI